MKKHYNKTKNFIMEHKIISGLSILVLVFILFKVFGGGSEKKELFTVKRADIVQKVVVNGKTKPVDSVSLAFEVNGTVRRASVKVGSRVVTGQELISLDQGQLNSELIKAKANLLSENVRLDELRKGTRPEEIVIAEAGVTSAELSLKDAEANLLLKLQDSYSKADDSIDNNIDQLFSNPRSQNPTFNFTVSNSELKDKINLGRSETETVLVSWKNNLNDISKSSISIAESNLARVSLFIDYVADGINSQTEVSGLSATTINSYKALVSTARSTMNTTISNLATAKEKVNSAESALVVAKNNLALKKGGNTVEVIKAQEARVMQMEAEVERVESQLSKMTLRSPQSGVVTMQEAKVGETVTSGKVVVSVISDNNLEIESNVSEINIGKVAVGSPASITFDAFPGEVFVGTVTYIEPAETIVDGVVNYKVTVAFNEKYPNMKSGLTSKLEITTGTKQEVLVVPQYSVINKNGETFVSKQVGENFVEVPVSLGLRGQDGFVEVLSGLSLGENLEAVVPIK